MGGSRRGTAVAGVAMLILTAGLTTSQGPYAAAAQTCNGKRVTLVLDEVGQGGPGTDGEDVVLITGTNLSFDGVGGDDIICVTSRNVVVNGGAGDDWISAATASRDIMLTGEGGDDTLIGSDGADVLAGDSGSDVVRGGGGDDRIEVRAIDGGTDTGDRVQAGAGDDTVEVLLQYAAARGQHLRGGSGDDLLTYMTGRTHARVDAAAGTITTAEGDNTIGGFNSYSLEGDVDFRGTDQADDVGIYNATATVDTRGGDDRIEVLGVEVESINTGSGGDRLALGVTHGETGPIKLGSGADTAVIGERTDATVHAGSGKDAFRIDTSVWIWKKDAFIRTKLLGQSGRDALTWDCKGTLRTAQDRLRCAKKDAVVSFGGIQEFRGGPRNDEFRGGSGPDRFLGEGGNDTMYGGKGRDRLIGGKGTDSADGGPAQDICRAERTIRC